MKSARFSPTVVKIMLHVVSEIMQVKLLVGLYGEAKLQTFLEILSHCSTLYICGSSPVQPKSTEFNYEFMLPKSQLQREIVFTGPFPFHLESLSGHQCLN